MVCQSPFVVCQSPFLNPPILILAGLDNCKLPQSDKIMNSFWFNLIFSFTWLVLQLEIRLNPSKLCLNSCFFSHFFPLINSKPLWFLARYPIGSHWIGSWKSRLGYMVSFPSEETSRSFRSLTGSGCGFLRFFMGAYLQRVIFTGKKGASKTIKLGYPKVDLEICKPTKNTNNIRKNKETHTLYLT